PPGRTILDACSEANVPVHAVGKISDVFCGRGVTTSIRTRDDQDGIERTIEVCERGGPALVFSNLVDFDSKFGHRNDAVGYARAIESVDARLPDLLDAVEEGFVFITGDHGCDPTTPGTDHTRERTPLLVYGGR